MEELVGQNLPFTGTLGIGYNSFQQWASAVQLSSDDPSVYKDYFYHQTTQSPVGGPYEIYYNGYGQGLLQIVEIKDSKKLVYNLLKQDYFARKANVFHNNTLSCSFKDGNENPVQPISQYKVALLLNVNTEEGSERYEEAQMFSDLINQDGGINGRDIEIVTTEYNGNPSELNDIVKELVLDDDLLFFIGTTDTEERNAINETLIEYNKLCFSIHSSPGQFAYQNIIILNRLPHQHLTYHLYTSLELFNSYSIVYDNTTEYFYLYIFINYYYYIEKR